MKKQKALLCAAALAAVCSLAVPASADAAVWQQQGDKLYCFDESGNPLASQLVGYNGYVYATGEDASLQNGWVTIGGVPYYADTLGRILAGGATPDGFVLNEQGIPCSTAVPNPACIEDVWQNGAQMVYLYDETPDQWFNGDETMVTADAAAEKLDGTTGRPLVAAYAETLVGIPYVWAGESAEGLDCSGLVKYTYQQALGYPLLHDAAWQAAQGTAVSARDLKPGDLCAYDWEGDGVVDHIGIYIGSGKVVEAGGSAVKITGVNMRGTAPVTCRNLFGD